MRSLGAVWERAAQAELERAGLRLVARNWHCRYGEIDLIMRDGDALVFVEVRYRGATSDEDPSASIGPAKQRRLIRAAELFLAAHPAFTQVACRFDSVAFSGSAEAAQCRWERSAFDAF
ncbi:YraN family protein [Tahibacter sp. UC22_41]|uniref:YraN family protein n=1 Tax=Tahibacter sp. UC22_41 TaxID=3350178 RepID=UPI002C675580|nr:YraN family protein [Tahibacter sp.]